MTQILDDNSNVYQLIQGPDTIIALGGNDLVQSFSGGGSLIFGNADADLLFAQGTNDTLDGGQDIDQLTSSKGSSLLFGREGDDILNSSTAGRDTLIGDGDTLGGGDDSLVGAAASEAPLSPVESLLGGAAGGLIATNNYYFGNQGNDTISGSGSGETMFGGQGNDVLTATATSTRNFLSGDVGNDTIIGGGANDTLLGDFDPAGGGNDSVVGGEGNKVYINGNIGNDTLEVGAGAQSTVNGGQGDDSIDAADAGTGDDAGEFYLSGDRGNDTILAGSVSDSVYGGDDNDYLSGVEGTSEIEQGTVLFGGNGSDVILGAGYQKLIGEAGNDYLFSATGTDFFDAGDGNDTLDASQGISTTGIVWVAGNGNDLLIGSSLVDQMNGGAGNDILSGAEGADLMTGGDGQDRFQYLTLGDFGDQIGDFVSGTDKFIFQGANIGGFPAASGLNDAQLVIVSTYNGTTGASGTAPLFAFETATKNLVLDTNGTTEGGTFVVATVFGGTVTENDIQII
ncbi:calcium-binding protein [Microcoleus sp. FACHB-68]|uniref:calcium-binding protein n=1 Tax=Microcoleus sp. FACHB-68 TaxID=2692826 RepID=UPI0016888D02|nr:calcium-binding protein [Microcoleus sp. FACHB-68]MBD1938830.1 calcium-binding protein [Microcoleus sp. FACHB-68]